MEQHSIRLSGTSGLPRKCKLDNFQKYVVNSSEYKNPLAEAIRKAELETLRIRFCVWRMLLGVINIDADWATKSDQLQKLRNEYASLWKKHIGAPPANSTTEAPQKRNPLNLMMKAAPTKNQISLEQERRTQEELTKGLQNVQIEIGGYGPERIRSTMNNVLTIWTKEHPEIDAKQSKFEILSCVCYAYYSQCCDKKSLEYQFEGASEELRQKYQLISSDEYAEADIYAVFNRIMDKHKEMFSNESDSKKHQINPNSRNNTPLLHRISHIWDIVLKAVDLELFRHMQIRQVNPRVLLSKWIRPLFYGQFDITELLAVWDNIFLQSMMNPDGNLEHLNFVCEAMLIYLRDIALNKESSLQIAQIYEKFPTVNGTYLQQLIQLSWTLREVYDEFLAAAANTPAPQSQPALHFISKEYLDQPINEPSSPEEIQKSSRTSSGVEVQLTGTDRKSSTDESNRKSSVNPQPKADEIQKTSSQKEPEVRPSKPRFKGDPLQVSAKAKLQQAASKPSQTSSRKTSVTEEQKITLVEKTSTKEDTVKSQPPMIQMTTAQWTELCALLTSSISSSDISKVTDSNKQALRILESLVPPPNRHSQENLQETANAHQSFESSHKE